MIPFVTSLFLTTALTAPTAPVVGTWLDPADTASSITLSNNLLTATKDSTVGAANVVARHGKTTGKWRFSTVFTGSGVEYSIGVGGVLWNRSTYPGASGSQSFAWVNDGRRVYNNTTAGSISSYTAGDILDVYVDADAKLVWFAKNGTIQGGGNPETGTGGSSIAAMTKAIYPLAYLYKDLCSVTFNFAGPFTYNPSSIFSGWSTSTASSCDSFRSVMVNHRSNGYFAHAFAELSVATTSLGTNLISGGIATSTSTILDAASQGIDANTATFWSARTTTNQNQGNIQYTVDMGSLATRNARFLSIRARSGTGGEALQAPTLFDVYFSADNVSYDKGDYGVTVPAWIADAALGQRQEIALTPPAGTRGQTVTSDVYWSNVATQVTFSGADASTTFTDNSRWANAVVANSGAALLNGKLELDGVNDYVTVAPGNSPGYVPGTAFSLEVFGLAFDVINTKQIIASHNNGAGGGRCWVFYLSASNHLVFDYWNGTTWVSIVDVAWSPTLGKSYDLAAMWDGTNIGLYVDGARIASSAFSGTFATISTFLRIGAQGNGSGSQEAFLNGRMSAIRWTRGVARASGLYYIRHALPLTTTQATTEDTYYRYVALNLSGQGVDGSTKFTDKSPINRQMSAVGIAQNDTDVSVNGTPSILLGADATYVLGDYSSDLDITTIAPDFCMEAYVSCSDVSQNNQLFARRRDSGQYIFSLNAGNLQFATFNGTTGTTRISVASDMINNTVYHICVIRSGTTYYMFVDGVLKGSATSGSGTVSANSTGILIGDSETNQTARYWRGSVNHCRITMGATRYALTGFSLPSVPYPTI